MKNRVLFLLTIAVLFFAPATTHAGFLMKKNAVVRTTVATTQATAASSTANDAKLSVSEVMTTLRESTSPSRTFVNMLYRGQVSTIALIFGVLGFFMPIFAIGAIIFGFMGFSYKAARKKGYGVAAFVLGVATIVVLALGGLAPLPIF